MAQLKTCILKGTCDLKTGQHPQHAIKTTASWHRVQMGARHQHGQRGILSFQATDQIASRINPNLHTGLFHPGRQLIATLNISRTETASTDTAIGLQANGSHLVERLKQASTIGSHRCFPYLRLHWSGLWTIEKQLWQWS